MPRRASSTESEAHKGRSQDAAHNIRAKPPHIYDNITRKLLQLGITLAVTTFVGLIVRYAVQEFDPSVSTITVTTSRVNNRDIASLSVSKHFFERILEFTEESIAIVAAIIPIGFPICTIFNRYFAKMRAGSDKIGVVDDKVLSMIPKYVVIGDAQACQMPTSVRLRPLVRDTIYQLIKAHLKPKLIVEDSYEEARKLGIRIGLIRREHHRLAVIKSVDLLKNITDSRGDIKQGKVRYLLSRMKIMSQSTPADKSLLIYLMKICEPAPNENLAYLGYSFTDPEAMMLADCAITFQDCDDEDVKRNAQVKLKSENMSFTDLYLFIIVCLLSSNITQSYALYQIGSSVSCCVYRFLSITVFQEQLISHSQFTLFVIIQQVFAIIAIMTKWLSSLPQAPLRSSVAEMSHAATEDSMAAASGGETNTIGRYKTAAGKHYHNHHHQHQQHHHHHSMPSISGGNSYDQSEFGHTSSNQTSGAVSIKMNKLSHNNGGPLGPQVDTIDSQSSSAMDSSSESSKDEGSSSALEEEEVGDNGELRSRSRSRSDNRLNSRKFERKRRRTNDSSQHIHLSGVDLDKAVINSKLVTTYKQTFHNSSLIDDVTYRLIKLQIAYQVLVMVIIMIFGNAMFQLNMNNNRQHQTLALNSLIMNNIFNLANCFNQFGKFNLGSGFRSHPFFICVLLMAIFVQVSLTELNTFGLENLSPIQWFVCFVFAMLSALIAPLTGQQQRQRSGNNQQEQRHQIFQPQQHYYQKPRHKDYYNNKPYGAARSPSTPKNRAGGSSNRHSGGVRKSQASVADS